MVTFDELINSLSSFGERIKRWDRSVVGKAINLRADEIFLIRRFWIRRRLA